LLYFRYIYVEEYRDLEIQRFMHDLYIVEIYKPGLSFLQLIYLVYLHWLLCTLSSGKKLY